MGEIVGEGLNFCLHALAPSHRSGAKFACPVLRPEQLMPFLSEKSRRIHILAGKMTTFPNWAMRHRHLLWHGLEGREKVA